MHFVINMLALNLPALGLSLFISSPRVAFLQQEMYGVISMKCMCFLLLTTTLFLAGCVSPNRSEVRDSVSSSYTVPTAFGPFEVIYKNEWDKMLYSAQRSTGDEKLTEILNISTNLFNKSTRFINVGQMQKGSQTALKGLALAFVAKDYRELLYGPLRTASVRNHIRAINENKAVLLTAGLTENVFIRTKASAAESLGIYLLVEQYDDALLALERDALDTTNIESSEPAIMERGASKVASSDVKDHTPSESSSGTYTQIELENWASGVTREPASNLAENYYDKFTYRKGKYEKTLEYEKRIESGWHKDVLYYDVELDTYKSKYDADTEIYDAFISVSSSFSRRNKHSEPEGLSKFLQNGEISNLNGMKYRFKVGSDTMELGSYIGSNAYGKKVEVSKVLIKSYWAYISNMSEFISSSKATLHRYDAGSTYVKVSTFGILIPISMSLSNIKNAEETLRLRVVIKKPKSILDYAYNFSYYEPTIDKPLDLNSTDYYMQTELIGIVLYDTSTRKVYAKYKL